MPIALWVIPLVIWLIAVGVFIVATIEDVRWRRAHSRSGPN